MRGLVWTMAVVAGASVFGASGFERLMELSAPSPSHHTTQEPPVALVSLARNMPLCGSGKRITCVVDGDTFWIAGEKVRLSGIDAPEINGACAHERQLAQRATNRLSQILSATDVRLAREGSDRYGRTLAQAQTSSGEAGAILIREGLARPWKGRKEKWC